MDYVHTLVVQKQRTVMTALRMEWCKFELVAMHPQSTVGVVATLCVCKVLHRHNIDTNVQETSCVHGVLSRDDVLSTRIILLLDRF